MILLMQLCWHLYASQSEGYTSQSSRQVLNLIIAILYSIVGSHCKFLNQTGNILFFFANCQCWRLKYRTQCVCLQEIFIVELCDIFLGPFAQKFTGRWTLSSLYGLALMLLVHILGSCGYWLMNCEFPFLRYFQKARSI